MNFITRSNFEGLEVRGSLQTIQDSDGDTDFGIIWAIRPTVSVGCSQQSTLRSELHIKDRLGTAFLCREPCLGAGPVSVIPHNFACDPGRKWHADNCCLPTRSYTDPNCEALGGTETGGFCRFQYTFFDNLIEDEENLRLFGEVNADINDNMSFHAEVLWHQMDMPD